jgi:hypothetical protein
MLYSIDPVILHFDNTPIDLLAELEYLEVNDCFMTDFFELLKYVGPAAKRMKIHIRYHRDHNSTSLDPMMIDQLLLNHRIPGEYSKI